MHKTLSLLLAAALAALLGACGSRNTNTTSESGPAPDTTIRVVGDSTTPSNANATDTATAPNSEANAVQAASEETNAEPAKGAIEKGANLAEALRAAGKVTYEYNADNGIWAHVQGKHVSIVIDEAYLNARGQKIVNALTSDIEPDVALSPDCFKPTAKIRRIEKD